MYIYCRDDLNTGVAERGLKKKKKANRKYFTIQEVTEQKTRIMTKKILDELVISAISPCSRADCPDLDNPQYLHS